MNVIDMDPPSSRRPLRLWPGVVALVMQWLVRFGLPIVSPESASTAILGGLAGGLLVLLWWLFFSRAPWVERLGALALMAGAVYATTRVVHPSIANGMMGMMPVVFSVPLVSAALVAAAALGRSGPPAARRAWIAGAVALACAALATVRTGGIDGSASSDLHWRWSDTPEERLLARAKDEPPPAIAPPPAAPSATASAAPEVTHAPPVPSVTRAPAAAPAAPPAPPAARRPAAWPGFRGQARDSQAHGVRIATDWTAQPPLPLWRRPVGPGWSSFAVDGDRIYTQEQRGDDEVVSCYRLATGEPVWRHHDAARFWESNAGAGPRATPALAHGRVYALGATGILNALDARDGSVVWSRNAVVDTGAKIPGWGIAGSPLVVGDDVIVAAAGFLAAYDAATGAPRWLGPTRGGGYSSPHLSTIDGVAQIVLLNTAGASGVAVADGALLWSHAFPGDGIVQPAVLAGGDLLIGTGSGMGANPGMRRVTIAHASGGWSAEERWTSAGLKPYFNDFVVHAGHAFGFDGSILACVDLATGERRWKGGRYGHGQLVALPDQDALLVLSEEGELVLVRAAADQFRELARFAAIEGKTWNHPVLVGDVVLVRNGEEMAAFRLPRAEG
ncbi:MAG: PQQ-binding-like beta-propeller repeat protein [Vicinamibacteria bacterium]